MHQIGRRGEVSKSTCTQIRRKEHHKILGPLPLPPTSACSPPTWQRGRGTPVLGMYGRVRPTSPSTLPRTRREGGGRHHRICIATLPDSRFQRTVVRTRRRYALVRPPSPLSFGDHTYKKVVYAYTNYGLRKSGVTPHKTDNFGFNLIGIGCLVRAFRI